MCISVPTRGVFENAGVGFESIGNLYVGDLFSKRCVVRREYSLIIRTFFGRVAIAGVLAQQPAVLLLDELTTFLDGEDQMAVLRTVRELASPAGGVTALWVPLPSTPPPLPSTPLHPPSPTSHW